LEIGSITDFPSPAMHGDYDRQVGGVCRLVEIASQADAVVNGVLQRMLTLDPG
jgi:hypothetical protein